MRHRHAPRRAPAIGQDGSGTISAWLGVVVFLALLLFAVQVLLNLYSTSVLTAAAYDAARKVAGANGGPASADMAEREARQLLGRFGDDVEFDWQSTEGDTVVLRVRARNPSVLIPAVSGPVAFGEVDRTFRVRVERFR